jgi:hypothetical protein
LKDDATEKYVPLINRLLLRAGVKEVSIIGLVEKVKYAFLIYY